jgi:hypothetical protein
MSYQTSQRKHLHDVVDSENDNHQRSSTNTPRRVLPSILYHPTQRSVGRPFVSRLSVEEESTLPTQLPKEPQLLSVERCGAYIVGVGSSPQSRIPLPVRI